MTTYNKLGNSLRKAFTIGALVFMAAGGFSLSSSALAQSTATTVAPPVSVVGKPPVPVVPEPNPGIILLPFFLAALLLSSRRLLRSRAAQKE